MAKPYVSHHRPRRDCNRRWCRERFAPTPAEIAAKTAEIRAGWDRRERIRRIMDDCTKRLAERPLVEIPLVDRRELAYEVGP